MGSLSAIIHIRQVTDTQVRLHSIFHEIKNHISKIKLTYVFKETCYYLQGPHTFWPMKLFYNYFTIALAHILKLIVLHLKMTFPGLENSIYFLIPWHCQVIHDRGNPVSKSWQFNNRKSVCVMCFCQKVAAFKRAEHSAVVTVSVIGNMTASTLNR